MPSHRSIRKLLIANRGEIACRVIRTCRRMGIRTVAVFSDADTQALHVRCADEAVRVGPADAALSYLNGAAILSAATQTEADAIHPGYGFLSENAQFVEEVLRAGKLFVGPSAHSMRAVGDKIAAKTLAAKAQVPCAPSLALPSSDLAAAKEFAARVGYPLMVKAAGGGGGRGMRKVLSDTDLPPALEAASREAQKFFNNPQVFLEKLIAPARHIEVQIVGDTTGEIIHLWDRDCTMQRAHQKVIEEAPAPNIPDVTRRALHAAAIRIGKEAQYENAGTVEFLLDGSGNFYFLEVNSRLQVEHPVTEVVFGVDLVEVQLRVAMEESLAEIIPQSSRTPRGAAIECRVCAEIPEQQFAAATGTLSHVSYPAAARVDSGFIKGDRIAHYYDSLLAKIIVHGNTRDDARRRTLDALGGSVLFGVRSNLGFLTKLLASSAFESVSHHITFAPSVLESAAALEKNYFESAIVALIAEALEYENRSAFSRLPSFRVTDAISFTRLCNIDNWSHSIQCARLDEMCFEASTISTTGVPLSVRLNVSGVAYCHDLISFLVEGFESGRQLSVTQRLGDIRWVSTHAGIFPVEFVRASTRGAQRGDQLALGRVRSPLPGKVIEVRVASGHSCQAGEALIVIESMKMEHQIKAPAAGKITVVRVKGGQIVEAGEVLLEIA